MNCSKCGSSIKEGTKFCTACGAPVSEAGDSEVATPVGVAAADLAADSVSSLDSCSTDSAAGLDSAASSAADFANSAATPDAGSVAGTKTQPIAAASSQGAEASSKAGDVADGVAAPNLDAKTARTRKILIALIAVLLAVFLVLVGILVFVPKESGSTAGQDSSQSVQPQTSASQQSEEATGSSSSSSQSAGATAQEQSSKRSASVSLVDASSATFSNSLMSAGEVSSVLESADGFTYDSSNATDGKLSTAWVEGASGPGVGEGVVLGADKRVSVSSITFASGYQKSEDIYYKNARPKQITLVDGKTGETICTVTLEDAPGSAQVVRFQGDPVNTSSIRLVIDSVYPGNKYEDCAISEISVA